MLSTLNCLESSVGRTGSITVQELDRAKVIEAHANGEIKASVAALRLQVSTRHVKRLLERYEQYGASGMISGRRGKQSNNLLDPKLASRALELVQERYADFGPTLACEMLHERHQVTLSKETLRKLMIEAGLWIPRDTRRPRLHQPRERRACVGELVQIDGSRHTWFEQRGSACTVLVFIDDATSRILRLHFSETETTASYFDAMRSYLQQHGKPQAFYADRAAVFRSPAANRHIPTQFQRALDELGIDLICANSPQAKGRVERANRTLQDRLVKGLRLDGISTIEAANAWAESFIENHNQRFARPPRSNLDVHAPLRKDDDLTWILSHRDMRKLSTKLTLQYESRQYVLKDAPEVRALVGQAIAIHTHRNGCIELRAAGKVLDYSVLGLPGGARVAEVDSKALHHAVDQLISKKRRGPRPYRQAPPAGMVATGVKEAKKLSAQKRVNSLS
jgi:transposase